MSPTSPDNNIDYDSGSFADGMITKSAVSYGGDDAHIENVRIVDMLGRPRNVLRTGFAYRYCYDVSFSSAATSVAFGMLIKTVQGLEIGGASNINSDRGSYSAGDRIAVTYNFTCRLLEGTYFTNAGCSGIAEGKDWQYLHRVLDAVMFKVAKGTGLGTGYVNFDADLRLERLRKKE